jgi:hypothetical protein
MGKDIGGLMVIVKLVIFKHNNGASKLRLCDYSQTSFERSPATIMNAKGLLMPLLLSPGALQRPSQHFILKARTFMLCLQLECMRHEYRVKHVQVPGTVLCKAGYVESSTITDHLAFESGARSLVMSAESI